MYSLQRTVYSVQFTVQSVHSVHCAVWAARLMKYSVELGQSVVVALGERTYLWQRSNPVCEAILPLSGHPVSKATLSVSGHPVSEATLPVPGHPTYHAVAGGLPAGGLAPWLPLPGQQCQEIPVCL